MTTMGTGDKTTRATTISFSINFHLHPSQLSEILPLLAVVHPAPNSAGAPFVAVSVLLCITAPALFATFP